MTEVHFLARVLPHYRVSFHNKVKVHLERSNIRYRLFFSQGTDAERSKNDATPPNWAEELPINYLNGGLCYQHALKRSWNADLLILGQENKLLVNYAFQMLRQFGYGPKLGFFGHGKNFQSNHPNGLAERFKKIWATKVDWWFAYTGRSGSLIESYGFERQRITVFNNTIDTDQIARELSLIDEQSRQDLRQNICGGSRNIAVYVGGLYPEKRLNFLVDAADLIREELDDFHLIVIGGGVSLQEMRQTAASRPWLHVLGPKFGKEKSELVSLASAFLMPGLVGLAIIDTFAYGVPMVTTAVSYHSPEIDYLEDGKNGIVISDPDDVVGYSSAVIKLLTDGEYRNQIAQGTATSRNSYSMEAMAERFALGVRSALESPRR